MKLSLRWLAEHVDLAGIEPAAIARELTMKTALIEGIERPGAGLEPVRVGHVVQREKHPNADRLSFCKVDAGSGVVEVVCGAPNVAAGQKICYAPVGCTLPNGLTLEARKIRGILSHGMICSNAEMKLGEDHDGIRVLPEDAPIGRPVAEVLGLGDGRSARLVDDDVLTQAAGQVNAFAEGLQSENDAALAARNAAAVFFQQLGARAFALHLHLPAQVLGQGGMAGLHLAFGGEQHQLPMVVFAQQPRQCLAQLVGEFRALWRVLHGGDAQLALGGVVERRGDDKGAAFGEAVHAAQPVKEVEAAAGGEGGRGAHGGADAFPQAA